MKTLHALLNTLPQQGTLEWIGLRPGRDQPLSGVNSVIADTERGLAGDHYSKAGGKRQVTLVQAEHLLALASMLGRHSLEPAVLRRNLVVRGINLLALKDKSFRIGEVTLAYTGLCHPCSKMERELGPGGYNALRGHGGITARIVVGGKLGLGDPVGVTESVMTTTETDPC